MATATRSRVDHLGDSDLRDSDRGGGRGRRVTDWWGFARSVAADTSVPRSMLDDDDAHQAALIGVWKALCRHRGDLIPAARYISACARSSIYDELRTTNPKTRSTHPPPCEPLTGDPAVPDECERVVVVFAVRDAVNRLPSRERQAVVECELGDRLKADLAREWGVTPSRVSQVLAEAHRRLRCELAA